MSADGLSSKDFNQLKSAIDEAAIVAITDNHGVITYVNEKFCAISKYSKEELVGKTHKVVNSAFHPHEFFVDMWKTISSGKVWEGEIRNRSKDGEIYWVHTTIVPFLDSAGHPERYVAIRYEITDRVMGEEQLKIQAKKLELSNKELQDFASVAAHDLQEPLRKIQSFADRVRTKTSGSLPEDVNDYLERIQKSANRMQILINDLLSYSRVSTRTQPFAVVDLNEILAQVVSDLEIRIERTHGKVEWNNLPVVEADPSQMHQLFMNLVNNALKFHRPDVQPIVRIESSVLERWFGQPTRFEIRVKDNGIGFDEKYLGRIFTIFQRLHGRNEYEGTGIGLSVCRKIVERHGGNLTAQSKPGEGATFFVTLNAQASAGTPI
jgi:two-component system sensor kinase FixL